MIKASHCISCANGTDALYIALRSLQLQPEDEVITSSHSWISTSEAITQAGGKVVFCDTDKDTFCIDVQKIKRLITDKTVGILPVHLYGHAADMQPIMKIATDHNLWIVEDCAQAHLSMYKEQTVGTFGDLGTFSFYPGKNLGAMGDAGAVVTNNQEINDWCKLFARHGGKGLHLFEGINSRMDSVQAAILNLKMPLLEQWTQERIQIAHKYSRLLSPIKDIITPKTKSNVRHVFHLYTIKAKNRNKLRTFLSERGIQTNINYPVGLPFLPAYSYLDHTPDDFPITYENQSTILSLPIFPGMTDEQINHVCESIQLFYK